MRPGESREQPVADERDDGARSRGKPGSESRAGDGGEPSAAERRAQALRDNLRRRKTQTRARNAARDGESPPDT